MAEKAAKTQAKPQDRLYVRGVVTSFRRAKRNQDNNMVLLKLEGVQDKAATNFYAGKRVVYIYKTTKERFGTKFRTMWGRIGNPHGANGVVQAKFSNNLPPKALGQYVRVMLYPSRV